MNVDLTWISGQFPNLSDIELIAAGGQKWVFKCTNPEHGLCVLKLFKPGRENRLDREIEAVFRLAKLNIASIYDINLIDSPIGQLAWVLEQYIQGLPLSELLKRGPLDEDQLLRITFGLLKATAAAEEVDVVHRDIKPDNIIIDNDGNPWLLDFGIARILDLESRTATDARFGPHTLGYGAPEQCRNRKSEIDGRTDLFAIGVVLYEGATGVNPFLENARDRFEILNRVEYMALPPLRLPWDHDGSFSNLISALTQKYPYQRPRSCDEALGWIDDILTARGVS